MWARATYRHFIWQSVPGGVPLSSIFVDIVQPTREGRILVGRASSNMVVPFQLQLIGGVLEPPHEFNGLDMAELAHQAAREFVEETGIQVTHTALSLYAVTKDRHGNIGIFFRAPVLAEAVISAQFDAMLSTATKANQNVEITEITFLRSSAELAEIAGPYTDYLAQIIDYDGSHN